MKQQYFFVIILFGMILLPSAFCATPTEPELAAARHFVAAKLEGQPLAAKSTPRIDVIANYGPVQLDARAGKPLKIGNRPYHKGFYIHAPSRLEITLDKPAAKFETTIGVDSNENTSGGRGSVRFAIEVGDEKKFQSETLREGMTVPAISVNLQGQKSFALLVDDAGDGISCDQADWADAKIIYTDGTEQFLSDLPIYHGNEKPISTDPIFSFQYGGKNSREFLANWTLKRENKTLDAHRTQYTLTYTDPQTALEAKVVAVAYNDFPTVEWTLYFTNNGKSDTPILSNIRAADTAIHCTGFGDWTLHHHKGDNCTADSYGPLTTPLTETPLNIANSGGRPTQTALPYFNISRGDNEGLIFVVSWAGQWNTQFRHEKRGQPKEEDKSGVESQLTLQAGQEQTHFFLFPVETLRQPMIVLQFWRGDYAHAQNVWRSWMIAHNIPRPGGQLPKLAQLNACNGHQFPEYSKMDGASQILFIDKYLEHGFPLDYWWMDAGWYIVNPGTGWWNTGTWEVDPKRFPGGLLPITKHGHDKGVKSIVWFEPERGDRNTWLANERPQWIHGGKDGGLLKLSEPEVLNWVIERVDKIMTENGVDLYRQDFNIDPLGFWRSNDTENRQGITEIRHVENYFKYWDTLRERHPNMLIDSCASGGRRNDLETLRRAVPLLRSDYTEIRPFDAAGNQAHAFVLPLWMPYFGTGLIGKDSYINDIHNMRYDLRTTFSPSFTACWDVRDNKLPYEQILKLGAQWKEYGQYYFGDYYTLTPYSLDRSAWLGWQFHDSEKDAGSVQMFRREESLYEVGRFPLFGLTASKKYRITNIDDASDTVEATGEELMSKGLRITIPDRLSTGFYLYE
jgi:alpha-galactosidase